MYQKFSDGWLKHMDFIILDIILKILLDFVSKI